MSEVSVSIVNGEGEPEENIGAIPKAAILRESPVVLLHKFMHEAQHSFGFFVKVDPLIPYAPLHRDRMTQGFFLMGDQEFDHETNSLGGVRGSLILAESLADDRSSSEDSIDSEDENAEASFNKIGRFSTQLNAQWHWTEKIFNSPMCDTEIIYGRGFEDFRRNRRNSPYNPRVGSGKYLRRFSESEFGGDKSITIRQLVSALTKSVTTIMLLAPEVRENGGVFFVKFNGIRIQEYMKYIPHGFFDFHAGGRIELEIYEGVSWVKDS
ncbi:hypothetical protein ABW20_dc0109831 [Dactylellina cionopaga]|nr:hypothetical protein ABW20_dc0109831 [Dactylellina cionopaga]